MRDGGADFGVHVGVWMGHEPARRVFCGLDRGHNNCGATDKSISPRFVLPEYIDVLLFSPRSFYLCSDDDSDMSDGGNEPAAIPQATAGGDGRMSAELGRSDSEAEPLRGKQKPHSRNDNNNEQDMDDDDDDFVEPVVSAAKRPKVAASTTATPKPSAAKPAGPASNIAKLLGMNKTPQSTSPRQPVRHEEWKRVWEIARRMEPTGFFCLASCRAPSCVLPRWRLHQIGRWSQHPRGNLALLRRLQASLVSGHLHFHSEWPPEGPQ